MTKINEKCKGCLTYGKGICPGYDIKDTECPCINCLVKSMCVDVCLEFQNKWYEKD